MERRSESKSMAIGLAIALGCGGCTTANGSLKTAGVAALISGGLIGGAALWLDSASTPECSDQNCNHSLEVPLAMLPVGGAAAIVALVSLAAAGVLAAQEPSKDETQGTGDQSKEARVAAMMMGRAAAAADAGDCPTVAKIDSDVALLYPVFHATVFVKNAVIVRCLGSSAYRPR